MKNEEIIELLNDLQKERNKGHEMFEFLMSALYLIKDMRTKNFKKENISHEELNKLEKNLKNAIHTYLEMELL